MNDLLTFLKRFSAYFLLILSIHADLSPEELNALKPSLMRIYTAKEYKEAFAKLSGIVKANPGDALVNSFLCDLVLSRPNSENSSQVFNLWTHYLETLAPEEIFKVNIAEAIIRNTRSANAEKYPSIQKFLTELGKLSYEDPQYYETLSKITEDGHKRSSEMVAATYLTLLKNPQASKSVQQNLELFLQKKTHVQARLEVLSHLRRNNHPPFNAAVESALELVDNAYPEAYKAINYLKYLGESYPTVLAAHEARVLNSIRAILMESLEGEVPIRAAELFTQMPKWAHNTKAVQETLKSLLRPGASPSAHRAASGALRQWKNSNRNFFNEVDESALQNIMSSYAEKSGRSITIKNCRAVLKN